MRRLLLATLVLVLTLPSAAHAGRVALVKVNTDPKYGYGAARWCRCRSAE
jgi:hypothetical protein